jgi:hypothetical protein
MRTTKKRTKTNKIETGRVVEFACSIAAKVNHTAEQHAVTDVVESKRRCKHIRLDGSDERIMRGVGHCRHIVRVGYKGEEKKS